MRHGHGSDTSPAPCDATRARRSGIVAICVLALLAAGPFRARAAESQRIENGKAVFAALDKVTARISRLEAKLGETVRFGALKVTPRACYSRPPTEPPKTDAFVEIDEILLDGKEKRIFTGWMFAESPGLHALEHPVFDVWLTDCAEPRSAPVAQAGPGSRDDAGASPEPPPRHRFRPRR
ncbi:MAG: DUF2155 domain-containing protein [Hyphomicrobiaceae bacterium]